MNKVYVLILFLLVTVSASAQTVRGRVVDNKDKALPGCNVYVVEMNKGTITDTDGYYEFNLAQVGIYTLKYTFMGYKEETKEISLTSASQTLSLDVVLKEESSYLDEVVVTGYTVERRRDLTGTIVKLDAKEITDMPTPSFEAALQGKAAGVQITQGSGIAGSSSVVRIRGVASISAGGDPLYVVDGIPITKIISLKEMVGVNNPLATLILMILSL